MSNKNNESWTMFQGNTRRTGSLEPPLSKPLLYWTIELGPIISSPVHMTGFSIHCHIDWTHILLGYIKKRDKMASKHWKSHCLISINLG